MAERWEAFPKVTRKMWLVATFILCALPLVVSFALPIPISGRTQAFLAEIDKLSEGDVILWGDSSASIGSYTGPREFWWALWDTIAERGIKVVYTCFDRGAPICAESAVSDNDLVGINCCRRRIQKNVYNRQPRHPNRSNPNIPGSTRP